ncbi:response regulator transcription factor [Fodinisporobacter ferrooxydans]|uniref:Response regulator transcription factor n=1 Tax=Fodinisporobacter ferrooxydans TaxID=2901836 RepID=A0ABY4CSW2_9BACL|nr:response regulator transcription factor [Alicyclobacillaceae bacterium MYW30-H2]
MHGRILVIEDEKDLAQLLELELRHEGYEVKVAYDGRQGLELALKQSWDVILLDIMLPEINGLEVCRRIRQESPVPILILTARGTVPDRVAGLDYGADDYMVKPFAIEELLARIRVLIRRHSLKDDESQRLAAGTLTMNTGAREVEREGRMIPLTAREFDLLEFLLINKNTVVSRDLILSKVWGYDYSGDTNIVDVYVRYLRSKMDEGFDKPLLHTVRGVGYVLKE